MREEKDAWPWGARARGRTDRHEGHKCGSGPCDPCQRYRPSAVETQTSCFGLLRKEVQTYPCRSLARSSKPLPSPWLWDWHLESAKCKRLKWRAGRVCFSIELSGEMNLVFFPLKAKGDFCWSGNNTIHYFYSFSIGHFKNKMKLISGKNHIVLQLYGMCISQIKR